MSKYRLSYLQNGGFISVDLSKLECLKDFVVTDINTIDKFTSKFESNKEIVNFLIKNLVLDDNLENIELQITIDKNVKETKITYNKPIFNSNKLIYKKDADKLNASYGCKIIRGNIYNAKYMQLLMQNYREKYQNAYNRINGSSAILSNLGYIDRLTKKMLHENVRNFTPNEIKEYESCITELIEKEVYKINKGIKVINKRGIHDLIILDNEIKNKLNINDNVKKINEVDIFKEDDEEFLTKEDYDKSNCQMFGIKNPYQIKRLSNDKRNEFANIQEDSKKYIKK